jgi:DNA-binding PadR family transcriptional regulator
VRVRDALMVLLAGGPAHGYQLKLDYERLTRAAPVNIGQVYKALDLLQRDGLAEREDAAPNERRIVYHATSSGRSTAHDLLLRATETSAAGPSPAMTKVLLALSVPDVDPLAVIDAQRSALVATVQATRRESRGRDLDRVERLAVEAQLAVIEAELRWLDLCEDELRGAP